MTIYLASFRYGTSADELRKLLERFGPVADVRMLNRLDGVAFADMDDAAASLAIEQLNGKRWQGRRLDVRAARPRTSPMGVVK